jgi:hypothetical protein
MGLDGNRFEAKKHNTREPNNQAKHAKDFEKISGNTEALRKVLCAKPVFVSTSYDSFNIDECGTREVVTFDRMQAAK